MKKWRIWLKRTAWVTMGLVLLSGPVGISARASDISQDGNVNQSAQDGQNTENTDSDAATNTGKTLVIKYFDSLDPKIQTQNLEAGKAPVLPDSLGVTVAIDDPGREATNSSGVGALNTVQTVGDIARLPESHITLSGVDWEVASTSETEKGTTYNYMATLPETYGEHSVEMLSSLTSAPVITATVAPAAAPNSPGSGSRASASTPSETPDGNWEFKGHGVTVIGSEETSAVWGTQANRIRITQPGTYVIKGTLNWVGTPAESTDPFIVLEKGGIYEIDLQGLNINISDKAYTALFSIPSGAIVNLSTSSPSSLTCSKTKVLQKVILNKGTLNLMNEAKLTCTGKFENENELSIQDKSQLTVDGDMENGVKISVSESSKLVTDNFINNGTLEVLGKKELGGTTVSSLTVNGRLLNSIGKTVTLNEGKVVVEQAKEPNEDGTWDRLIDNRGTFKMLAGATAETKDVQNASGATLTVNGMNTKLTGTGTLENQGKLTVDEGGAVETAILNNLSELTIGKSPINAGSVTITENGANNVNKGTIVVESGSFLQCTSGKNVTLTNEGSLTIRKRNCVGTLGTNGIHLAGGGTFIFTGLEGDMLSIDGDTDRLFDYDGDSHTQEILGPQVGGDWILESKKEEEDTEGTESTNKSKGVVSIAGTREINDAEFQVDVKATLKSMTLTRAANPEDSSNGWTPGNQPADPDKPSDTKDVRDIEEPGEYRLVYYIKDGTENTAEEQNAEIRFTVFPWSMSIVTDKGDDEASRDKYGEGVSAVYDNKEPITATVKIAIFDEKNSTGRVTLYWDAYEKDRPTVATTRKSIGQMPVLSDKGTKEVTFTIPTENQNYILKPNVDPNNLDSEAATYEQAYRLTAVYEHKQTDGSWKRYYSNGTPQDQHKQLIREENDTDASPTYFANKLEGWYADKKLIIKRRVSKIAFDGNYYSVAHVYDAEPLVMPKIDTDVRIQNTNEKEPSYEWYKGTDAAVHEAYEKKTTDGVSGLDTIQADLEAEGLNAPKNAGWYLIKAKLPSSEDYLGCEQLQLIRIEPKDATITVDRSLKKFYGADDPKEWEEFQITSEPSLMFTTDGFLPQDVGEDGKLKGSLQRDEKGEECGRYEVTMITWVDDANDPTKDNYRIKVLPGQLEIKQRELEWDTDKMITLITDDGAASVVGGLKTRYRLEEGETEEDRATIENNLKDDDIVIAYNRLDLSADKSKITIVEPRPNGEDKDNYVIQNKSLPAALNLKYKVSVKPGTVDASTMAKLQEGGAGYSTEQQVISELESQIRNVGKEVSRENIATYDILLTNIDGSPLSDQQIADFPWGALTVTIPYPAGTSKSTSFVAAHMFTEDINLNQPGTSPGNVETRGWNEVARVDDGVRFQITSLSPVTIGWAATGTNNGGNTNDPNGGNGDGTNNGNNGSNNNNNGTNNGNNGNNSNNTNNTNNSNNKATNSNSTKATNSNTTRTSGVRTGDTAEIAFYMIATLIACLLLILIICLIRMQFRKKE